MTHRLPRLFLGVLLLCSCATPEGESDAAKSSEGDIGTMRLASDEEPPGPPDAVVVANDIPDTWSCGEQRNVHIRMRNVGESDWLPSVIKLGAFETLMPFSGPDRVNFEAPVPPQGEVSFNFPLEAPIFATNEYLAFSMLKQQGTQWFGQLAERNVSVNCSGDDFNAEVADASFPTNVECGQTFAVSAIMRNTGSVVWLPSEHVALGAGNDDDPFTNQTRFPINDAVLPGDSFTFHMTFTAPPGTGDYDTDWRMVRDAGGPWFGQTLLRTIHVNCDAPPVDDSQVSWDMPSIVACGDFVEVNVDVVNTGTTTWRSSGGQGYELRRKPNTAPLGEPSYAFPPNVVVPRGGEYTFTIGLQAPPTQGSFPVGYQLYNRDRQAFFGASVQGQLQTSCVQDNARVVESSFASEVGCGRPYPIRIRMRNTGFSIWTRDAGYALGNSFGTTQFLPPTSRVELPPGVAVHPNEEYLFEFTLTAPFAPNDQYLQSWRMVHGGNSDFFGDGVSKFVAVRCDPNMADVENVSFPDSLPCGQSAQASITFRNMGSAPWLSFRGYRLGAVGGSDPFHSPTVEIPIDIGVLPGNPYTFAFNLVAPYENRVLTSDWQLQQAGASFGPIVAREINVTCPSYGARVVSVIMTNRGSCDPEAEFAVTMRNEGLRAWGIGPEVYPPRISFAEPDPVSGLANETDIAMFPGEVVKSGQTRKFLIHLRRPAGPFGAVAWWRMLHTPQRPDPRIEPFHFGDTARIRVPAPCSLGDDAMTPMSPDDTR